jgi:hypothetical protein
MPVDVSDSTIMRVKYMFDGRLSNHHEVPYKASSFLSMGGPGYNSIEESSQFLG